MLDAFALFMEGATKSAGDEEPASDAQLEECLSDRVLRVAGNPSRRSLEALTVALRRDRVVDKVARHGQGDLQWIAELQRQSYCEHVVVEAVEDVGGGVHLGAGLADLDSQECVA
jgi:hypothetical protein